MKTSNLIRLLCLNLLFAFILVKTTAQNVGINTTNPDAPLSIQSLNGNNNWLTFKGTGGTTRWAFSSLINTDLTITEAGTARLILGPNGISGFNRAFLNIGLNITNPSADNGVIMNVQSTNGPHRFRVLENGTVGIGTVNPDASSILDIQSTNRGLLMPRMSTTQRTAISNPATGLLVFDTSTDSFWFFNGSAWEELAEDSNLWGTNDNDIHFLTGNVGIGNTTPDAPLSIQRLPNNGDWLTFKGTGGATRWSFSNTNGSDLALTEAGTERLILRPDGTTGIGNATPDAPLSIQRLDGNNDWLTFKGTTGTTRWSFSNTNGSDLAVTGAGTAKLILTEEGTLGIGTTNPDALLSIQRLPNNGNWLTFKGTGGTTHWAFNNTNGSDLAVTGAGTAKLILTEGGTIGIGTTNPDASSILDIQSTNRGLLIPRMTTTQRTAISNPATGLLVFDTSNNSFWFFNGSAWEELAEDSNLWGTNDDDIHFLTGNVGIGNTTPDAPLSIQRLPNSGDWLTFKGTAGATRWAFSNTNGNNLALTEAGTERLILTEGGTIGIGSTTPDAPLSIQRLDGNNDWLSFKGTTGTTRWAFSNTNGSDLAVTGAGTAKLILTEGGTIGIGSTNPDAPLSIQRLDGNNDWLSFKGTTGTTRWSFSNTNGSDLAVTGAGTAKLILTEDGTLGIGSTNPDAPLSIQRLPSHGDWLTFKGTGGATRWAFNNTNGSDLAVTEAGTARFILNEGGTAGFNQTVDGVGLNITSPSANNNQILNVQSANGTNRFRVLENGTVGIGTANPDAPLSIQRLDGNSDWLTFKGTGGTTHWAFSNLLDDHLTVTGSGTERLILRQDGRFGFNFIYGDIGLTVRNASSSNSAILRVETSDGTARFRVAESGGAVVWGDFFVSNGSKNFIIDHPLDPANKSLRHSCVESPEVLNVYSGTVILNAAGQAQVELPDYFEALNKDFRYQLTCLGGYAPVYIQKEVENNRFEIAGGTPGLKVSWQVTGVRNDPWFRDHPYQAVEEKTGREKGRYYYPEGFGMPAEMSIGRMEEDDANEN